MSAEGGGVSANSVQNGATAEAAERRGGLVRSGEVHRFRARKRISRLRAGGDGILRRVLDRMMRRRQSEPTAASTRASRGKRATS